MADKKEKRGLGRGLSALMADVDLGQNEHSDNAGTARRSPDRAIPVERIRPNPEQPRRDFDEADLKDLAASISEKGIIQPLILRTDPIDPDSYQIVAGERRWRAAQLAQLHEVPAIVREFDDTEVLEIAIIENIQRADLNPIEEALGYRQLQEKFGHTQEQLSSALGKSRSHIANLMRLLALPDEILTYVRQGKLSAGHARALITADDPKGLARLVVSKGLSVRETEKLAKRGSKLDKNTKNSSGAPAEKDADTRALEQDLTANLKMKVSIDHKSGTEKGQLSIQYKDFTELDEICRLLSSMPKT